MYVCMYVCMGIKLHNVIRDLTKIRTTEKCWLNIVTQLANGVATGSKF